MSYGIRTVVGGPEAPVGDEYIPFALCRTTIEQQQIINELGIFGCVPRRHFAIDIGCGFGRMTPLLLQRANTVWGLERDDELLEMARRFSHPKIEFKKISSLSHLGASPGSVDLLMSYTVLQHVRPDEIHSVISEIKLSISVDGYVLLCEDDSAQSGDGTWGRSPCWYAKHLNARIEHCEPRVTGEGAVTLLRRNNA